MGACVVGIGLTERIAENHLSFIETSALDASNVELAFQNILTGWLHLLVSSSSQFLLHSNTSPCAAEIYRIVSSKALDPDNSAPFNHDGHRLDVTKPADAPSKDGKCC